jgi:hypothetical protein
VTAVTTQLVDPTMIELSGVTTGANISQLGDGTAQGWIVLKGLGDMTTEETTVSGATATPAPAAPAPAPAAKDETGGAAATAPAADAPTVDVAALQAENASLKAQIAEAAKGKADEAAKDEDEDSAAEKSLAGITDERARAVLAKALSTARQDREAVAKMLDDKRTDEATAFVDTLKHLPTGDKFVAVVKALSATPEWSEVARVLVAAETAVTKSATDAASVNGARRSGGDAEDQIEVIAKGLLAAGSASTIEQARAAVYISHPDLVAATRAD